QSAATRASPTYACRRSCSATSSDDMTAKPWYSGERGVTQLTGAIGSLVNDVRRVRRAWHWDTPRPHTWPERGAVIPPSESDLGWARQEPVRTGGAQGQLHASSTLLKSGWNLVLFPEGSRSQDGRIHEFKPGVGHLANETRTPVVPVHIRGAQRIMPKGQKLPLPAQARVRIGKPMTPKPGEGSREFTTRVEKAVRTLAETPKAEDLQGTWIERWRASKPRELVYGED